jgi:hypothetical protein
VQICFDLYEAYLIKLIILESDKVNAEMLLQFLDADIVRMCADVSKAHATWQ